MATNYGPTWNTGVTIPVGSPYSTQLSLFLGTGTVGAETVTLGATNDTYRLCKLPKRVSITDALIQVGDLDSSTGLVFSLRVTDGTTTKTIIDQAATGQAGGVIRPTKIATTENGLGFTTTSNAFWLEILIVTAPTTPAAGIFKVFVNLTGGYLPGAAGTE